MSTFRKAAVLCARLVAGSFTAIEPMVGLANEGKSEKNWRLGG